MKVDGRQESFCFVLFSSADDALRVVRGVNETLQFAQRRRVHVEFSVDNMLRINKYKQQKAKSDALKKAQQLEAPAAKPELKVRARSLPQVVPKEEAPAPKKKGKKQPTRKELLARRFNKKKSVL